MKNKIAETIVTLRERERERESHNLKKIISQIQKSKFIGVLLKGDLNTPKHKTKPMSDVPTSDLQPPTSATAITLITLVITIIILLILAGVTLNMVIRTKLNICKSK